VSQHEEALDAIRGQPTTSIPTAGGLEAPSPSRSVAPGFRRGLLVAALVVASAPVGRAWFEGRAALLEADASLRAGDTRAALTRARDAAGWWLPGSPFAEGAFARMRHIGHTAEASGDLPGATAAWRALLASAARVRWPTEQLETEVSHARAALARIESRGPIGEPAAEPASAPGSAKGREAAGGAKGGAGAAFAVAGGLGAFGLGAAACVRRGAEAVAARWPVALAGAGLVLAAFGWG
jgi:hypothetical protein